MLTVPFPCTRIQLAYEKFYLPDQIRIVSGETDRGTYLERWALTVSMRTARRDHRDHAVLSSSSSVDEVCTVAVQQVYRDKANEDFYRGRGQRRVYFSSFLNTRIRIVTGTALPRSRGGAVGLPHASTSVDCKIVKRWRQ